MSSNILSKMSNIFPEGDKNMVYGQNVINDENGHAVFKIFHSSVNAGKRIYREHHHTAFEISVFMSGSGTYSVNSKNYSFMAGDVFVFSSDEVHCITEVAEGEKFDLVNIQFEPRYIWCDDAGLNDMGLLKIFFDRNKNFQNRLERSNPAVKKIIRLIREIENEFKSKDEQYRLAVRINLISILITLIRGFDYVNKGDEYTKKDGHIAYLREAMNYINSNLASDITLDILAKKAHMSRSRFSTYFKKYNGISPWDYITIKRIEMAMALIKDKNLTKLEIACKCGFNNTSNFYRAFKKITGKSPSDFSRQV